MVSEDPQPIRSKRPKKPANEPSQDIITPVPLPLNEKRGRQNKTFHFPWLKGAIILLVLCVLLAGGWIFLSRLSQRALPAREIAPGSPSLEDIRPQRLPETDAALVAQQKAEVERAKKALLEERTQVELQRLLREGLAALSKKESDIAIDFFQGALIIDPGNGDAQDGLARAETLKHAQEWLASAQAHEAANDLFIALADYQEAMRLDPESREARDGMARVKDRVLDTQFQELLSKGLASYHKGDLEKARHLILEAASVKPGSSDVTEALALVNQALQQKRIEKLRKQALDEEEAEAWEQARNVYGEVLKIDKTIRFAVQGFARMETRLRLKRQVQAYLGKPEAMELDRNFNKANMLLEEMKALDPKGPKWLSQIQTLDRLLQEAQRQIRVVLLSDGETDVAVYRVGIFGRFQRKELVLRPGTYTVVGFRDGYKDVRTLVRIKPDDAEIQIRIACVERI